MRIGKLEKDQTCDLFCILNRFLDIIGENELTIENQTTISNAINNEKINFFVARDDENKVIGMCSVSYAFTTFGGGAKLGIFEDFYIDQEFRKKGIARKLVEAVFENAKENDCSSVIVTSSDQDKKMYLNFGFKINLGNTFSKVL